MSEQQAASALDSSSKEPTTAPASPPPIPPTTAVVASPVPASPRPAKKAEAEHGPHNTPVNLDHPDIVDMNSNDDVIYVFECFNEVINSGPHVGMIRRHRGYPVADAVKNFLLSHPHIRIDWKKGFHAFPHVFAAIVECDRRKALLYLRNPDRIGAEEMFPGEPNRILEEGKPDDDLIVT